MIIRTLYCLLSSKHLRNTDLALTLTSSLTLLSTLKTKQLSRKEIKKEKEHLYFYLCSVIYTYTHNSWNSLTVNRNCPYLMFRDSKTGISVIHTYFQYLSKHHQLNAEKHSFLKIQP